MNDLWALLLGVFTTLAVVEAIVDEYFNVTRKD